MCPQEHLSHISNALGLSFELKRIGPLTAFVTALIYLLALFLSAVSNTTENLSASFYSELLIQITCLHLLLLVGFDTLIYESTAIHPLYLWVISMLSVTCGYPDQVVACISKREYLCSIVGSTFSCLDQ